MAQKKKVREIFRRADSNGDGKLDLDEFMDHFKAQGVNMTRQEAQLLFKEKDRDQDNFIGLEEFLGEATETEKVRFTLKIKNKPLFFGPFFQKVWKALDGNKNGGLSREELQTGLKKYKKSLPGSITRGHFLEKYVSFLYWCSSLYLQRCVLLLHI